MIQCFVFLNLSIALVVDEYQHIRASQIQKNSQKDDNKEQETEPQNKEPQSEQQVLEETLRQTYGDTEEGKRYLTLLAEIEETTEEYRSQAALLDLLVDSFVEAPEEEDN
uniref:cation channel sperm-associated protein 1-like n=1 Tax=Centroberyx gerrardi TaxID=166262 RepID=UPI003AAEED1C